MLSEPASALTDLLLGAVSVALAIRLERPVHLAGRAGSHTDAPLGRGRHPPAVDAWPHPAPLTPHWRRMFWWTASAALAGAVHHGFVTQSDRWSDRSWLVVTFLVVVAISYLLAASVEEVLGPGHATAFWVLRSAGLLAYVLVAVTLGASIGAILLCEGVTMLAVLTLWGIAIRRGHPRGRAVAVAILASAGAAAVRGLPPDLVDPTGLDPTSLYHLAQIPGLVLLYRAAAARDQRGGPRPSDLCGSDGLAERR